MRQKSKLTGKQMQSISRQSTPKLYGQIKAFKGKKMRQKRFK